jgi:hypothetical protein
MSNNAVITGTTYATNILNWGVLLKPISGIKGITLLINRMISNSKNSKNKYAMAPSQNEPIQVNRSLRKEGYNLSRKRAAIYERTKKMNITVYHVR